MDCSSAAGRTSGATSSRYLRASTAPVRFSSAMSSSLANEVSSAAASQSIVVNFAHVVNRGRVAGELQPEPAFHGFVHGGPAAGVPSARIGQAQAVLEPPFGGAVEEQIRLRRREDAAECLIPPG